MSTSRSTAVFDANGVIYIGAQDNNFYILNPNGTLKQIFITLDVLTGAAALNDNVVYFGGFDQKLHALGRETGIGR